MKKRLQYLDFTKGFAIILMLFAHTMAEANYIHRWIFSFHMPIFFIVSGLIMFEKYGKKDITLIDVKVLIKNRVFQLGIPYIIWGLALTLFYTVLEIISKSPIHFWNYILKLLSLNGIDSLWFLPCYFFAEVLVFILLSIKRTIGKAIRCICVIIVIVYITTAYLYNEVISSSIIVVPLICKVSVGALFCYMGYWIAKKQLISRFSWYVYLIGFLLILPLTVLNGEVAIGSLTYNNGFLFIVNATGMSISLLGLFYQLEHEKNALLHFLSFFGKSTIVVLCTNNLLIESFRLLDSKITNNILLSWGLLGSLLFTAVLLLIEAVFIRLSYGKIGVLFGRRIR